jgi:nitroreductase
LNNAKNVLIGERLMIFKEPLETVVRRRYSVRTYSNKPVTKELKEQIAEYIKSLSSPFPAKPAFTLIETELDLGGNKLGTYGMIKGANLFIAAEVTDSPYNVEALGYEFEKLILFLTTLELGTCWLGGTFDRKEIKKALGESGKTFIPAISPVGYYEKKSFRESLVRGFVNADKRKPWDTLFFDGSFAKPLSQENAGLYAFPLEMLRLGPSASNKQPWRVVREEGAYHFYEHKIPGYSSAFNFDMQSIDMGIAACHFHLAAIEKGLGGRFELDAAPALSLPDNTIYKFTWISY